MYGSVRCATLRYGRERLAADGQLSTRHPPYRAVLSTRGSAKLSNDPLKPGSIMAYPTKADSTPDRAYIINIACHFSGRERLKEVLRFRPEQAKHHA